MTALSPAQRLILTTAAERADGAVLPLPEALPRRGRAMILESLRKRGLIAARPDDDAETLAITHDGRATLDTARQPATPRQGRQGNRNSGGGEKPGARLWTGSSVI